MNFDDAFQQLIGNEGGYVNNPKDPGGETKYGISKRGYPNEDIVDMTLARAKVIYLLDYWTPAGCEMVIDDLRFDLFDMAVNQGVKTAIRALQMVIGVTQDGIIGPDTLAAIYACHGNLIARFNGARLLHYTVLPGWEQFGRGWANRIANNLLKA